MRIRKLKIEDFEDVGSLQRSFAPGPIRLEMPEAEAVEKALAVILKSARLRELAGDLRIRPGSRIAAEIAIGDDLYHVTARGRPDEGGFDYEVRDVSGGSRTDLYGRIQVSEEEDRLSWFRYDPKDPYSRRLNHYKESDKYYPEGAFAALTDGIGCTRAFRALLNEYIAAFEPQPFPGRDDCRIALRSDGIFVPEDPGDPGRRIDLDEKEKESFEYQCFVGINDFWRKVESVRNCNHVARPLIVDAERET